MLIVSTKADMPKTVTGECSPARMNIRPTVEACGSLWTHLSGSIIAVRLGRLLIPMDLNKITSDDEVVDSLAAQ